MAALLEIIDIDILTPKSLPNIGVYKIVLHIIQFFLAFLVLCLSANVISVERTYYGASQAAVNYSLVISLITLVLLVPMTIIPWTKLSGFFPHKLREGFFLKSRPNLVLNVFFTIFWFIAMVSVAVHSNNDSNCSLDSKLEKDDSNYIKSWLNQCNCAKAAAAFCVFSFFLWVGTTAICVILFWHEKKTNYSDSKAPTIVEEPSNKEETGEKNTDFPDFRSSFHDKQDLEATVIQPTPTVTPLTLTSDFTSPYSPEAITQTCTPQGTSPYSPPAEQAYIPPHHNSSPYTSPPEHTYIPPQNVMYTPSPFLQSHLSPHISTSTPPHSSHISHSTGPSPMAQSPPLSHNPSFQSMYQRYSYA